MGWWSALFAAQQPAAGHHSAKPSLHLPTAASTQTRWQRQREDEQVYGAPSPRITSNVLFSASSTRPNSPASATLQPRPFFNEKLASPIGMGAGQLILDPRAPGLPAPLKQSWDRIERALSSVPELVETFSAPVDLQALSSFEQLLDERNLKLPQCVKDYFLVHDGQDSFSAPAEAMFGGNHHGLFWGLWAMSVEEVVAEWKFWRRLDGGAIPRDAFSTSTFVKPHVALRDIGLDEDLIPPPTGEEEESQPGMTSFPRGWIRHVYSHHGWIPLATDRAGNYIGIDLCPPPRSTSTSSPKTNSHAVAVVGGGQANSTSARGQVIAFGREIDEKVVLWSGDGEQGWAKWLSSFAEDLETGAFGQLDGTSSSSRHPFHNRQSSITRPPTYRGEQSSSESDDEGQEDGLGDVGYFNDGSAHGYGEGGKSSRKWKLRGDYRGLGIVQALCERSRRRWIEVGMRGNGDAGEQSLHSPGHASSSSHPLHNDKATSPSFDPLHVMSNQDHTPLAYITPPSPKPKLQMSTTPKLGSVGFDHPSLGLTSPPKGKQKQRFVVNRDDKKSKIPPPVVSVGLPTLEDLMASNVDEPSALAVEPTQTSLHATYRPRRDFFNEPSPPASPMLLLNQPLESSSTTVVGNQISRSGSGSFEYGRLSGESCSGGLTSRFLPVGGEIQVVTTTENGSQRGGGEFTSSSLVGLGSPPIMSRSTSTSGTSGLKVRDVSMVASSVGSEYDEFEDAMSTSGSAVG